MDLLHLPEQDRGFLEEIEDDWLRGVVESSLVRHRRADRLGPGDVAPTFELTPLEGGERVPLHGTRERPLVLIFGSYT